MDFASLINAILLFAIPVLLGVTLHEAGHAWAADRLGDDTARNLGRVTLNPLPHIDPLGTILLPLLLVFSGAPFIFGWAKPVPVMFSRLLKPRRDIILVAAAGPAANILIATICGVLLNFFPDGSWMARMLTIGIFVNLLLAFFNLLPIPPLDGGRIAVGLLPAELARPLASLERYGFLILIGLVFLLPVIGQSIGIDLSFVSNWIRWTISSTMPFFTGLGSLF